MPGVKIGLNTGSSKKMSLLRDYFEITKLPFLNISLLVLDNRRHVTCKRNSFKKIINLVVLVEF